MGQFLLLVHVWPLVTLSGAGQPGKNCLLSIFSSFSSFWIAENDIKVFKFFKIAIEREVFGLTQVKHELKFSLKNGLH